MNVPSPFLLEQYFADYQSRCDVNIGSSGCAELSVAELLAASGTELGEIAELVLSDADPAGAGELRALIASQYQSASFDDILVTHGSSEALYLAMAVLLSPGDQVVTQSPSYQALSHLPLAFGATIETCSMWDGATFRFPVGDICERIAAGAKLVIVNSPHNPTGAMLLPGELEVIAASADRHGAWLLIDEAFADIVYDGATSGARGPLNSRCLLIGTLSKSFGLTGLRVGWCYAPKALLDQMLCLKHYITINASPLIERLAIIALQRRSSLLEQQLQRATEGLRVLSSWIQGVLQWTPPKGGVCCYPRLPAGLSSRQLCIDLAVKHGVFVVPGWTFGDDHHIRIGFGGGARQVTPGIRALERELDRVPAH